MANVLLVDDHPDVCDVVGQLLKMHGHRVNICANAESAWECLHRARPDAVIVDQRLPGISGVELLHRIRQDPHLADVPVIIFSADDSSREEARRAGASDFWLKGSDLLFDGVESLGKRLPLSHRA